MIRDDNTAEWANAVMVNKPECKRLVAQIQAAIGRLSMRDDRGIDPLSAAFYLHERHTCLEAGVHDGDHAAVESALADLYVATVWVADGYGVALKKAYQNIGQYGLGQGALGQGALGQGALGQGALGQGALGQGGSPSEILQDRRVQGEHRCLADEMSAARSSLTKIMRNIGLYEIGYGECDPTFLQPLHEAIPELHVSLLDIGARLNLNVFDRPAAAFRLRSMSNLASTGHNPLYARAARQLGPIVNRTYCPFAATARLWGAPEYDSTRSVPENVRRSLDSLLRFTRAARREVLDGFVYAFPADEFGGGLAQLAALLRTVIGTLMEHDPCAPRTLDRNDVVRGDWRFSFNGEDYFAPVFAPLYGQDHSRYTYEISDTVFILLQPDSSFHARLGSHRGRIRKQIRQRFSDGFQPYDTSSDIEAHRFLLRPETGTSAPAWYDADVV